MCDLLSRLTIPLRQRQDGELASSIYLGGLHTTRNLGSIPTEYVRGRYIEKILDFPKLFILTP